MIEHVCPFCGNANLDFDEVDIGVGVLRGNYRCGDCLAWDALSTGCSVDELTSEQLEKGGWVRGPCGIP